MIENTYDFIMKDGKFYIITTHGNYIRINELPKEIIPEEIKSKNIDKGNVKITFLDR